MRGTFGWHRGALVALALALGACGGGGGGGGKTAAPPPPSPAPSTGGIEGTGRRVASSGAITQFGSIFVNGVEYSTDHATIQVDGRAVTQGELKLGQVVTVVGTLDELGGTKAVADTVTFTAPIVGPVQSIDAAQATLVVLGQPVLIDGATQFAEGVSPASLAGLAVGTQIEVSGFRDSRGVLAARSVALRGAGQSLAATGDAATVDEAAHRLTIGALVVDYSAAELAGFDGRQPRNGDFVRAEAGALEDSGTLKATRLALVDRRLPANTNESGHLQGRVTRFASAADFDVDGYRVTTDARTQFNSAEPAGFGGLRLDRFVTVFGVLLADGRLLAADIRTNNLVTINALAESVSAYEIAYGPYVCQTAGTTWSVDGRSASWSAVKPGDVVTLYQSFGGDQPLRCPIVTVNRALRGPVESVDAARGRLRIMGQQVHVNGHTHVLDDSGIRPVDALATLQPGDLVEVAGYRSSTGQLAATRVGLANAESPRQVTGELANLDAAGHRFSIGALTIDYATATVAGFPSGGLASGQRVIVRGTQPSADTLRATELEYDSPTLRGTAVGPAHVLGPVTAFTSASDFYIEGRHIQQAPPAPTNPQIYGTCVLEQLRTDGFITAITATRPLDGVDFAHVGIYPDNYGRPIGGDVLTLSGRVESVDLAGRTLVVAGHQVALHPLAELSEPGGDCATVLQASSIAVGDTLVVTGDPGAGAAALIAGKVSRPSTPASPTLKVSGRMSAFTDSGFFLDGLRIGTAAGTTYGNCGAADSLSAAQFAAVVRAELDKPGGAVFATADGAPSAGSFELATASTVEICLGTGEVTGTVRAQVDSIDPGTGRLVLLGIPMQVDGTATVEDRSSGTTAATTLDQVAAGQFVEVSVRWFPLLGTLDVSQVAIVDRSGAGTASIDAMPDGRHAPDVIVLGRKVYTDANTVFSNNGAAATAQLYFDNTWDQHVFEVVRETDGSLRATRVTFVYLGGDY